MSIFSCACLPCVCHLWLVCQIFCPFSVGFLVILSFKCSCIYWRQVLYHMCFIKVLSLPVACLFIVLPGSNLKVQHNQVFVLGFCFFFPYGLRSFIWMKSLVWRSKGSLGGFLLNWQMIGGCFLFLGSKGTQLLFGIDLNGITFRWLCFWDYSTIGEWPFGLVSTIRHFKLKRLLFG